VQIQAHTIFTHIFTRAQAVFWRLSLHFFSKFLQLRNQVYQWNMQYNYCIDFLTMKATILDTHGIFRDPIKRRALYKCLVKLESFSLVLGLWNHSYWYTFKMSLKMEVICFSWSIPLRILKIISSGSIRENFRSCCPLIHSMRRLKWMLQISFCGDFCSDANTSACAYCIAFPNYLHRFVQK